MSEPEWRFSKSKRFSLVKSHVYVTLRLTAFPVRLNVASWKIFGWTRR